MHAWWRACAGRVGCLQLAAIRPPESLIPCLVRWRAGAARGVWRGAGPRGGGPLSAGAGKREVPLPPTVCQVRSVATLDPLKLPLKLLESSTLQEACRHCNGHPLRSPHHCPDRSEGALAAVPARNCLSADMTSDEAEGVRRGLLAMRQNVVLLRDPEDSNSFYPVSLPAAPVSREFVLSAFLVDPTGPPAPAAAHRAQHYHQLQGSGAALAGRPAAAAQRLLPPQTGGASLHAVVFVLCFQRSGSTIDRS